MSRLARVMGLTAKIETVYGQDANPTPQDNAILTKGLAPQPYQGNTVTRDLDRPSQGAQESINTNPHSIVSFEVELAGSGAPGTAPMLGVLLRACGFSETIDLTVGSEKVVYAPISLGYESATLYFYRGGELHKMVGARGTFSIGKSAQGIPTLNFTMTGWYARPEKVTMPTFDWTGFQVPLPITKDNTPTFVLHGNASVASELSIDIGLSVSPRNLIGHKEVVISERSVSGSLTIDAPELDVKNYFEAVESHQTVTTGALQVVHGLTSGNIVQVDAPKVQLTNISHAEADGILQYSMNTSFIPVLGDDELTLTFK